MGALLAQAARGAPPRTWTSKAAASALPGTVSPKSLATRLGLPEHRKASIVQSNIASSDRKPAGRFS